ncbi:MAG: hypothetical protein U0232_29950 [Thermomicrobiales bacterium]
MADTQIMPTVREVLQWDAAKAYHWVVEMLAQPHNAPERFNWHGLAEIAAADASRQAEQLAQPRQRFPKVQQEALALALAGEQYDAQALDDKAQGWLDKALPALNHARIAVTTYHQLADREGLEDGASFLSSAMTVRAYLIQRLGMLSGDQVLDPDRITDRFFADFSLSPSEARERAEWARRQFREQVRADELVDTLRLLRRIKNALRPIISLVEAGAIQPSLILAEWLAVREQLP